MENRYISYEIHERCVRRWFALVIILIVLWAATALGWIIAERMHYYDDLGYETIWFAQDEEPTREIETYG